MANEVALGQVFLRILRFSPVSSVSFHRWSMLIFILLCTIRNRVGRDSSVGIATRYGLDGPGIQSRWRRFSAPAQTGPVVSNTMGTESFRGVVQPVPGPVLGFRLEEGICHGAPMPSLSLKNWHSQSKAQQRPRYWWYLVLPLKNLRGQLPILEIGPLVT